jgi:DNA-binding response OmpR family regulator
MKILLIEDEQELVYFLKKILENAGNSVTSYASIQEALNPNYSYDYDLLILDLMLPGKPGSYLLKELRKRKVNIPVLVLSAINQITSKTDLLNLGADDYMTKPFDAQELLARINALYRRYIEIQYQDEIIFEEIVFYPKQNKVVRQSKEVLLTQKEGELLHFLIQNKGKTVRSQDILHKIWHANAGFHSNVLQATIRRLRQKIDSGFSKKLIHSIHGIGYRLGAEESSVEETRNPAIEKVPSLAA